MAKDIRLGLVVEAIDRASAPLRRISTAVDRISRKTGLDRVGRALGRVGRGFRRVGREAMRVGRNIAVMVAGAGAGLFAFATKFARVGDNIAKVADKLGLPVTVLQRLRYAANLAGIEIRTFDMAMQRFTRRVAEAAAGTGEAREALKWMGIQLKDSSGKIRPAEVLLGEVADRFKDIKDPALRLRIAFKLFDSEGVAMVNMLNDGQAGLKKAGDEAERLGIMTDAQARASERFVDNMARMKQALAGVGYVLGADLLPIFERWLIRFREWLVANRGDIARRLTQALRDVVQLFKDATQAVRDIVGWLADWRDRIAEAFPILGQLFDRLAEWVDRVGWVKIAIGGLVGALSIGLITAIAGLFVPLATLTIALGVTLVKSLALAGGAFAKLFGLIKVGKLAFLANPWVLAFTAIAAAGWLVYKNWETLSPKISALWDGMLAKVFDVVDNIRGAFSALSALWDGMLARVFDVADTIRGAFRGIGDWIVGLFTAVPDRLSAIWDGMLARVFDVADTIRGAFRGIGDWIVGLFTAVPDRLSAIWDGMLARVFDVVDKIRGAFAGVAQFFRGSLDAVVSPPGVTVQGGNDAALAGGSSAARSAFEGGGGQTRVGGEVRVTFENMPASARVKEISTENPDVPLEVEAGYAMGTA